LGQAGRIQSFLFAHSFNLAIERIGLTLFFRTLVTCLNFPLNFIDLTQKKRIALLEINPSSERHDSKNPGPEGPALLSPLKGGQAPSIFETG